MQTNRPRGRYRRPRSSEIYEHHTSWRPGEEPEVGDLKPDPPENWGRLYCIYKVYNADFELLYVGQTSDLISRLSQHETAHRDQRGRRRVNGASWWTDVAHITVEHLPPGTTEWEAKVYQRSQLRLGPRYNREHGERSDGALLAEIDAVERDARQRADAHDEHELHDGVTRRITPIQPVPPPSRSEPVSAGRAAPLAPPPLSRSQRESGPLPSPALPGGAGHERLRTNGEPPQPSTGVAVTPEPTPPASAPPATLDRVNHQGRYALLLLIGMLVGIILLFLVQIVR